MWRAARLAAQRYVGVAPASALADCGLVPFVVGTAAGRATRSDHPFWRLLLSVWAVMDRQVIFCG